MEGEGVCREGAFFLYGTVSSILFGILLRAAIFVFFREGWGGEWRRFDSEGLRSQVFGRKSAYFYILLRIKMFSCVQSSNLNLQSLVGLCTRNKIQDRYGTKSPKH